MTFVISFELASKTFAPALFLITNDPVPTRLIEYFRFKEICSQNK